MTVGKENYSMDTDMFVVSEIFSFRKMKSMLKIETRATNCKEFNFNAVWNVITLTQLKQIVSWKKLYFNWMFRKKITID